MTKKRPIVRLRLGERLRDSERQPTSMSLPLAVHHRLDLLAEEARDVEASRAEIIAMLIANCPLDSAELESSVLRYRKLLVEDVVPGEEEGTNVVSIRKRRPGRPAREERR